MRAAGGGAHGARMRGLTVVLWRAGLRISEALGLSERDLDPARGAIVVRHGKGGKRREIGMDEWGWAQLRPWLAHRASLPIGALFCVISGPTRGRRGLGLQRGRSFAGSWTGRASGAGSPRISFGTLTPSRWRVRGCP